MHEPEEQIQEQNDVRWEETAHRGRTRILSGFLLYRFGAQSSPALKFDYSFPTPPESLLSQFNSFKRIWCRSLNLQALAYRTSFQHGSCLFQQALPRCLLCRYLGSHILIRRGRTPSYLVLLLLNSCRELLERSRQRKAAGRRRRDGSNIQRLQFRGREPQRNRTVGLLLIRTTDRLQRKRRWSAEGFLPRVPIEFWSRFIVFSLW